MIVTTKKIIINVTITVTFTIKVNNYDDNGDDCDDVMIGGD